MGELCGDDESTGTGDAARQGRGREVPQELPRLALTLDDLQGDNGIFVPLGRHHDRQAFDCGEEKVNNYLWTSAGQQMEKFLAVTTVYTTTTEEPVIAGYYTLLMRTVQCEVVPAKRLPKGRDAGVILLGQFGTDRRFAGRGIGQTMLYSALRQAEQAARSVGCLGVVLDALTPRARAFYEARGFSALNDDPNHLWMPMQDIRKLFGPG